MNVCPPISLIFTGELISLTNFEADVITAQKERGRKEGESFLDLAVVDISNVESGNQF